jgi:DNA repair protein RecN (Recombination protein N)
MLLKLSINNFAIIKQVVFQPSKGLNIITGETGAGKSIILDALNLILGSRADIKTQSEWSEKCVVEGEFALNYDQFEDFFTENDIDFEAATIIRREISSAGKSRTFINDTPVTLQQLKSLGERLISIHSQHENTHLNDKAFQFNLVDHFAGVSQTVAEFRIQFRQYKEKETKLTSLKSEQDRLLKEKDYLEFLINEFESLALQDNEEASIEAELNILSNAEQIVQVADWICTAVSDSENAIADVLTQIRNKIRTIENVSEKSRDISVRINAAIIELKDIVSEAADLRDSVQADDNKMEQLNERLNAIQHLKRKHNVTDYADLLKISEQIADQLINIGNIDRDIDTLQADLILMYEALKNQASTIHVQRQSAALKLSSELEQRLHDLEMPNAKVVFDLAEKTVLDEYGCTDLIIKFNANLGMTPQPLNKVASGGELSRLALCIRSIEASNKQLNTLIFDEIDTGVSGKVADTIGKMFKQISNQHQLIAITHLPQVAGYGDDHFMVCKKEEGNSTVSYLKHLNPVDRIDELAKMLSGDQATDIARENAKELLKT